MQPIGKVEASWSTTITLSVGVTNFNFPVSCQPVEDVFDKSIRVILDRRFMSQHSNNGFWNKLKDYIELLS